MPCNEFYYGAQKLCITSSGNNVIGDFTLRELHFHLPETLNWTMYLQKRDYSGATRGGWMDRGSRTGYTSVTSPSSRTFTDVGSGEYRIQVRATNGEVYTSDVISR